MKVNNPMVYRESQHQKAFFEWLSNFRPKTRSLTFAIPNGGRRDAREARNLKLQGVTPGVPDIFMAIPSKGFNGLFIELKSGKNKTTKSQDLMIYNLRDNGYRVDICYGWEEAKNVCMDYLDI
jgi:hypothetical protein